MFKKISLCLLAFLFTLNAQAKMSASDTQKAESFIETLYQDINKNVLNKKTSRDNTYMFVKTLLVGKMDLKKISSFILGPHWRKAEDRQKVSFQSLFEEFQVQRFTNILRDYKGQTIIMKGTEPASGKNQVFVNMLVQDKSDSKSDPILLKWRVYKSKKTNQFKIVDVVIAGISMSVTLKGDYNSLIQKAEENGHNGLDHLILQLEEKIDQERNAHS